MISRVADHCFWFGRYIERAESTARLLAATMSLSLDAELPAHLCWRPVIVVAGEEESFRERFATVRSPSRNHADGIVRMSSSATMDDTAGFSMMQAMASGDYLDVGDITAQHQLEPHATTVENDAAWGDGELVQRFMTWDEDNRVSLRRSISGARWNARAIRDVVSLEAWEIVNEMHLWMSSPAASEEYRGQRDGFYRQVRRSTQLTLGLLRSTMLHDEPLDFIWLGMLLERIDQTARTLDVHHHAFTQLSERHEVIETSLWLTLLRALSGSEPFMKRSQGRVTPATVSKFLVDESQFPRSIAYGVRAATERLEAICGPSSGGAGSASIARLRTLQAWMASPTRSKNTASDDIHDLLTHVVDEVHSVCDLVGRELLGYAER